jgi:hypothetical protein
MSSFIPGRELSQRFYRALIRPLLEHHFPQLPYSAALIGPGSDVLGFDTEMSADHDWGSRLFLFLRPSDMQLADRIHAMLSRALPPTFYGYPVGITLSTNDDTSNQAERGVDHRVIITSVSSFVWYHLAYDVNQPLLAADWLTFPAQILRELTDGVVHHDGVGELTAVRQRLSWYPYDIWLYLLASGWNCPDPQKLGQLMC